MKKRTSIIAIIIAILILGVGSAVVSNVTLNIGSSTVTMTADQSNFDVVYDVIGNMTQSGNGTATFTRTADHNVSFTVTGFTKKGDTITVTIPFKNMSTTLKADMADAVLTNSNTEYFSVSAVSLASTTLNESGQSGDSANLVITVTAEKTPVSADETTTITGTLVAAPSNS